MHRHGYQGRKLHRDSAQRTALLRGLMDTDGCINKNGRILSFSSANEKLAHDFRRLLCTFGKRRVRIRVGWKSSVQFRGFVNTDSFVDFVEMF